MKRIRTLSIALIAGLALGACGDKTNSEAPALTYELDEATRVTLADGEVIGTRGRDDAFAWYGIPFAAPPVGDLRWRAPRPVEAWDTPLEATFPFNRCAQLTSSFEPDREEGELAGKEDCLYLNVWAPSNSDSEPKPVMVWIHGGANVWGYAGQYEMGRLAQSQDVVVVGINYRLAMMGWFGHPSIVSTAETDLDRSMNFGTLDQIAALEWIQKNIGAFGGDPNNVTVFGQSAGAFNVAALISSPLTEDLFHKAIVQSGGFRSTSYQDAVDGPANEARRRGAASQEFVAHLVDMGSLPPQDSMSPEELATRLRAMSPAEIFDAYKKLPIAVDAAGLINPVDISHDGVALPEEGIRNALINGSEMRDVPLMVGTTKDEFKGIAFVDKEMVGNFFNIAFWPKNKKAYTAYGYYPNALWSYHGVEEVADYWTRHRSSPVYTYRFDWDEQGKAFTTDVSFLVGASHSLEIPFVIGGFDDKVGDPMGVFFNKKNRAGRESLSGKMMEYWANFAYEGAPGKGRSGTLPEWSAWKRGDDTDRLMILDTEEDGGVRMIHDIPSAEELFEAFQDDKRFRKQSVRCKTADMALEIMNIVGGEMEPWEAYQADHCNS
ncbi:carboxylesterase/lipase family protein [Hyphomonas atlantica]|uniref:Carboxylic ester hydrolase n=1 Tax=Hyphomonas atlantica TaxID=1280948 RepID=A0A059E3Y9_9PROT|nr:carboxylesterase family protein [Hyphomonas atlantica]KCZ62267.1 hypothetical protein HY36_15980 [Hyphomonas atlantica]